MSSQNRLFYAVEDTGISPLGLTAFTASHKLHGVQSIGLNTKYTLEQVFELGQVSIYQNVETIPDIEINIEKCLDGYPLAYHLATYGAASNTLAGRANTKTQFALSLFSDSQDAASGTPNNIAFCSGIFTQSFAYNFPVEGVHTENVVAVGNNKIWANNGKGFTVPTFAGVATNTDVPAYSGGVARRHNIVFYPPGGTGLGASTYTILPSLVEGISSSGTNNKDSGGNFNAHVQSIKVSANLGREQLHELGRRGAYHRYVQFPVEVKCDIEILGLNGDSANALEEGINPADGTNQDSPGYRITVKSQEGTYIDLGVKNKLQSVSFGGGNAGGRGGNVSEVYNFLTYNDCIVAHPADPMNFGGY